MRVSANGGTEAPTLPGTFYRFMLKHPPDFLASGPDAAPVADTGSETNKSKAKAADWSSRDPYVLMLMREPGTRVVVQELATAEDLVVTPTGAPPAGTFGAASEATPERPESPEEVTGLIERLILPGAAANSDGGTGAGEGGGGAQDIAEALATLALKDSCSQCGKQGEDLLRCSICKHAWYCGAACQRAAWKGHKKLKSFGAWY